MSTPDQNIVARLQKLGQTQWGKDAHCYFSHSGGRVSLREAADFYDNACRVSAAAADKIEELRGAQIVNRLAIKHKQDQIEKLRVALSSLLVEYVAGRKEGHIDSFPAAARKVVNGARVALDLPNECEEIAHR